MNRSQLVISSVNQPVVPSVLEQHAEEAAGLYSTRTALLRLSTTTLYSLRKLDDRLAAHLDGLATAGEAGWRFHEAGLEQPTQGSLFCAAVRAIENRQAATLDKVLALSAASPRMRAAVAGAFEWVAADTLQGIGARLLVSPDPFARLTGVGACASHRIDPGPSLTQWALDDDPGVRARALRAGGELGRLDLIPACAAAIDGDAVGCQTWGAWSSVLFENRGRALEVLLRTAFTPGSVGMHAFRLALQAMNTTAAHAWLQEIARDPRRLRWLIQGSGIAGDPVYVPWLIKQMDDASTARVAAEAFTLITGVDLAATGLEGSQPQGFEAATSDNPDDEGVDMDPDEGLPWPDVSKIRTWWQDNANQFPHGSRSFMGAPVTREHCIEVLKTGYQRQRTLAAHYLCLLEPGTPLFNTSAPAWRQQKLLAQLK